MEIGSDDEEHPCEVCIKGKLPRTPFPPYKTCKTTKVLELVHSDVVGKVTPKSKGGANYLVTFIDDYTRYAKVYTMKTKGEVLQKFKEYKLEAENILETKIKILRSDNGGEYRSREFDEYLRDNGIQRQLTVPGNPQQNGVSERFNRTLFDMVRCMLIQSGLPNHQWAEAATAACHVRNLCPSRSIGGRSPSSLWNEDDDDIDHLKVFGCRAWSVIGRHIPKGKLDPRAIETVFIGYPEGVKGYKLWDFRNDRILVSRDVKFEEDVFPFQVKVSKEPNKASEVDALQVETETDANLGEEAEPDTNLDEISRQGEPNAAAQDENTPTTSNESFLDIQEERYDIDRTELPLEEVGPTLHRSLRQAAKRDFQMKCNAAHDTKDSRTEPRNLEDALSGPESSEWKQAMRDEMANLEENDTWELVPRPQGKRVIKSKWVYKKKYTQDGKLERYKARLVARGFMQIKDVDYKETFSPVTELTDLRTLRTLIAIAVELGWQMHQIDITAAYLNGTLTDETYMEQPSPFVEEGKEDYVCKLKRSIYGLHQSGREWNNCLDEFLKEIGLKESIADPCVYYNIEQGLIVGVYVDDKFLIVRDTEVLNNFKTKLLNRFKARDLGEASEILSIKIERQTDGSVCLDQTAYAEEILNTFGMADCKPASTPLDAGTKFTKESENDSVRTNKPYREVVGSLLYLANGTRPDLAYAVAYMSQFCNNPTDEHWSGLKHILRYLQGTKDRKLCYKKTKMKAQFYSDADWASDVSDRKSYSGYTCILAGAAVSWRSRKQEATALSTTEAEYIAMCHASKEVLWFKSFLNEIGMGAFIEEPTNVFVDNQGAIHLVKNKVTSERSKHIDLKFHFLRDQVKKDILTFKYVPSRENKADIFTKTLPKKMASDNALALGLTHKT